MKKYFPEKNLGDKYSHCKIICSLLVIMLTGGICCGCGGAVENVTEAVSEAVVEAEDSERQSGGDASSTQNKGSSAEETRGDSTGSAVSENDTEIIERRDPVKVKGIYVSGPVAGIAKMDALIDLVDQTELNAMVIDIKNDEGRVTYKMQSDQVLEIDAGVSYIGDIEELVSKCKEKNIYLIARIVAFRDPYLAEQKPEWAVHTKDGAIFRDKSGLAWVNPYKREVWDYLAEIASQAAGAGFDEIQFDYIRFSTDIKEEEVDYGDESEDVDKIEIITEFTEYMYETLVPQGVYVAADVFGTVIDNETDQAIVGQDYVQMAQYLDYICPMVYPSHYYSGSYGIPVPDAEPYSTIYAAASSSAEELKAVHEEDCARVRLWLQSFTANWVPGHISYGREQIRAQIKGAYDAGYDEWILWNAAVNYQPESLLTDEEAEAERAVWDAERQEIERQKAEEQEAGQQMAQPETVSGNG
ncbi:MAG: putative glycoside hydrolase [Lachnospiraceae bacterium]|nr:putative glycoside hydrolase [Lachnospiraceae bacterium]